jgi:Zn-dependent protease
MPFLRFSRVGRNLFLLLDINFAQLFIAFSVLLFSLTVHEMAHAWTADRLGDPTARLLGRVSMNPLVHADLIGTVVFPLLAMVSGVPLLGWAKPVPVNIRQLRREHRDFAVVAAAGPASNVAIAFAAALILSWLPVSPFVPGAADVSTPVSSFLSLAVRLNILLAVFNMLPIPPLDGGNVLSGLLPRRFGALLDSIRPYGFLLLYALLFTDGFYYLVVRPSNFLRSWLP